jgi:hypothetical protein
VRVSGFYAGAGSYRIRFMPQEQGTWRYRTGSNHSELDGITGQFECRGPRLGNHGPVHVHDAYNFAYADGTPYHPIGTTCYVWNLQGETLEAQTLATLRKAPFNKIRFCVFPKNYEFNHNEPPSYPFPGDLHRESAVPLPTFMSRAPEPPSVWDLSQFNSSYFEHLERCIADLQELGIEADLILFHPYDFGAWGFDQMPQEINLRYLRYVVARLSAFRNVWWSFANEYDLLFNRTIDDWDLYFKTVQDADPYAHLRSIHNCVAFYDHSKPWVTHCSVQHHDLARMTQWQRHYGKPVIVDECGYEGNIDQLWGDLPAQELVRRFWLGFADGGYVGHGETYWNEQEVLWWSKGGTLRGESVARIAFLRDIVEAIPGPGLSPLSPIRFSDFSSIEEARQHLPWRGDMTLATGAALGLEAAGRCGSDYFLLYFGMHQPLWRTLELGDGDFFIDVIDTWDMTISRFADHASGHVRIALPVKPYQAIRIQRRV